MLEPTKKKTYFLTGYFRCGEMPLYLIFYRDLRGFAKHSIMLCSFKKLRELLIHGKHFDSPSHYGKVLFSGYSPAPTPLVKEILKSRFGFDLDKHRHDF